MSTNAAGTILASFGTTYDLDGEVIADNAGHSYSYDAQATVVGTRRSNSLKA